MVKSLPAMQETVGREDLGEENGKPLQHSCLGNSTDRGAWWATAHGVVKVIHDLVSKATYSHPGGQGAGPDGASIQRLDELLRGWGSWWEEGLSQPHSWRPTLAQEVAVGSLC